MNKPFDPETMEASCPECGVPDDFDVREYDFGTCRETGYRDAGERATCRTCGFSGELRGDFERTKPGASAWKLAHAEQYCPSPLCLWRTGDGSFCPRHKPFTK